MKKISLFLMLAAALAFGVIAPAQSTPTPISTTIGLSTVYTGNTPDNGTITGPWLTAIFTSTTGSTTGTLTLTSNLGGSDFVGGQNGPNTHIGWSFYLNAPLASTSPYSCTSGTCANSVSTGLITAHPGGKKDNGLGNFNLTFAWAANTFNGSDSATYTLNFADELMASPFSPNNPQDWWSVAHVQGITGGCSGWIVSGDGSGAKGSGPCSSTTPPPTNVPEPTNLGMFGIGLLAIGLFLGLRRRMV